MYLVRNERPRSVDDEVYSKLVRVFLIGDTRTGIGNALVDGNGFAVAKVMTGTLRVDCQKTDFPQSSDMTRLEVYDTPGLNDKGDLDVAYIAAIEDEITGCQYANAIIMTIAAGCGISGANRSSLQRYESLFGVEVYKMLVVVLTTNEEVDDSRLASMIAIHWPTVKSLSKNIVKNNVMAISLPRLRKSNGKDGKVVFLRNTVMNMPYLLISSVRKKKDKLRQSLFTEKTQQWEQIQVMERDGWIEYNKLMEEYERSTWAMPVDSMVTGFVTKKTSSTRKATALLTCGILNLIKKTAYHVETNGRRPQAAFEKFLESIVVDEKDSDAMRKLANMLNEKGLAVMIKPGGSTCVGTLRVKRFVILIWDPQERERAHLVKFLEELLDKEEMELPSPVLKELCAITFQMKKRSATRAPQKKKSMPFSRK